MGATQGRARRPGISDSVVSRRRDAYDRAKRSDGPGQALRITRRRGWPGRERARGRQERAGVNDLENLQGRISTALERIRQGAERLAAQSAAGDAAQSAALAEALDAEKLANAQLENRIAALREKHEAERAGQASDRQSIAAGYAALEQDLQRLRAASDQLRQSNQMLRDANAQGLADAELIDAAQSAEIEALRAQLNAERAESDVVLAQLSAMLNAAAAQLDQQEAP